MIFKGKSEENGWIIIYYNSTWHYGYDFMLDAAQSIINNDFKENLQFFSVAKIQNSKFINCLEDVEKENYIVRNCNILSDEYGVLTLAGISKIMNCPFQIGFYNQSNTVILRSPSKEYFEKNGEHVFDNYMNSIEIKAYCADTKRTTIEEMKKNFSENK